MSDTIEPIEAPGQLKIPSPWRMMHTLASAMEMLSDNPDLVGDDVRVALESEAPDTVALLNAMVLDIKRSRGRDKADTELTDLCIQRMRQELERSFTKTENKETLLTRVMQNLRVRTHRAPAGTAYWSERKGKLVFTDKEAIPDKYKIPKPVKIEYTYDTKAIDRDLDDGISVPGVMRGNGGTSLTIKG